MNGPITQNKIWSADMFYQVWYSSMVQLGKWLPTLHVTQMKLHIVLRSPVDHKSINENNTKNTDQRPNKTVQR